MAPWFTKGDGMMITGQRNRLRRVAVACCGIALFAGIPLRASGIVTNGGADEIVDGRPVGWYLKGPDIRAERGAGMNASGGIVWRSEKPSLRQSGAGQVVALSPGTAYNFEVCVRTENFKGKAQVCLECADANGKDICGSYAHEFTKSDSDWVVMTGSTSGFPSNAVRFSVYAYVHEGSSGYVAFDKVNVEPLERDPVAYLVSSRYRNLAAEGPVSFHASLFPPADLKSPGVRFSWRDAKGVLRSRPAKPAADASASLTLDVTELAMGRHPVRCELCAGDGRALGSAACLFERVESLPERRVWIDRHHRCIVDGRLFFPLGMYAGKFDAPKLAVYRKGPFNCVMPYTRPSLAEMDAIHEAGLKAMVILKDEVLGSFWARKYGVTSQDQVDDYLRKQIEAFRGHPALLGWYVNDEAPLSEVGVRRHHYEVFVASDSQHPTWMVMDRANDLRDWAPTADVMGGDPYPIPKRTMRCVTDFQRIAQRRLFGAYAMWNAPQAFNMSSYAKDMPGCRFPTLSELRSVNWQHIAGGANGLVSFVFGLGDEFLDHWADVCAAGEEVRRLTPVLLSVEPVPQLIVSRETLACRVWSKDGDIYLLACNVTREPLSASVGLGEGSWTVRGHEIGTAGQMQGERTVGFDLAPLGVSIVRLGGKSK